MTAAYRLTATDIVIRAADEAHIPNDPNNGDRAQYQAWLEAGGVPDPYVVPVVDPCFVARDLMAQFTPNDYAAIQTAIASSAALGLLWASLLAQGDAPIVASAARFQAGWAGLKAALGASRAAVIAAAVGIPNA